MSNCITLKPQLPRSFIAFILAQDVTDALSSVKDTVSSLNHTVPLLGEDG